jgi:hypothetical protein
MARPPGFSQTRLDRMHHLLSGHVARGDVPGLVTALSRQGEVRVDAIGTKAMGGDEPIRRDTIFRITSMTKPITAAAAMILVEESKLRVDEPVDHLLPELNGGRYGRERILSRSSVEAMTTNYITPGQKVGSEIVRQVRVGWRLRYVVGLRSKPRDGRDLHVATIVGFAGRADRPSRFLDVGIPGDP